jgi:predicted SnoaL-like aldol condensation-catalyzing enzyme
MEELPTIDIELLGDNSFQTMNINVENVKQLRVSMARSGAVTDIAFCYPSTGPTPVAPTKTPTTPVPPTKAPIGDAPPNSVPGGPECIYINAGGPDYLDPDGVTWQADEGTGYFTASDTFTTSDDISNTDKPDIYQSERYASELMYDIDLANGEYNIFLHFAEIFKESFEEGARVMDIFIEGDLVTVNLDVYKAAGNAGNSAYILSIADVIVADGSLTIDFVSVKQNATISAVEICASSPSDGPDAPSASPSESPSKSSTSPNYHRHLRFGHN